jgi:hypothetical protein
MPDILQRAQNVMKFSPLHLYGTRVFITVLTTAQQLDPVLNAWILSITSLPISLRSVNIITQSMS